MAQTIEQLIRQARRERGLTQAALSSAIGISLGELDRYESGRADPSASLERIAEATGKPLAWFVGDGEGELNPDDSRTVVAKRHAGARVTQVRRERGLTQRELAQAVGVPLGRIDRLERGAEAPSELIERISAATGRPISWFLAPQPALGEPSAEPPDLAIRKRWDYATNGDLMTDSPSPKPEGDARVQKLPSPPLKIPYEDLPRRTFGYDRAATAQLFAEVAKSYERLGAERSSLEERIGRLEADLADERAKQANASGSTRELKAELEQARRHGEELKAELEQAREQGQQLEAELERFREREAESGSRLERSEAELSRFRERERSLAEALILARQTASELLERTEREAEELVAGAKQKAAEIVSGAERELDRLTARREQLDALTSEVQEDLSTFLLGTLERLKAQPTEPSPAPAAAADEPNGDETPAGDGTAAKAPRADTRAKPRARPASS